MKAVFIDKDGVINKPIERGEAHQTSTAPWTPEELEIYDGVEEGLRILKRSGYLTIVVTNQPDIAYGNMTEESWKIIRKHIEALPLDDIYVCFHGRDEGCHCKKPAPGMLEDAAKKWNIDFKASYIVGDTRSDIGAGESVGVTTILIDAPYNQDTKGEVRVQDFREAVDWIIEHNKTA